MTTPTTTTKTINAANEDAVILELARRARTHWLTKADRRLIVRLCNQATDRVYASTDRRGLAPTAEIRLSSAQRNYVDALERLSDAATPDTWRFCPEQEPIKFEAVEHRLLVGLLCIATDRVLTDGNAFDEDKRDYLDWLNDLRRRVEGLAALAETR